MGVKGVWGCVLFASSILFVTGSSMTSDVSPDALFEKMTGRREGARAGSARDITSRDPEIQAVEEALRSWYEAIRVYDFEAIESALTPTFLILEDTTPLDRTALLARLKKAKTRGSQAALLEDLKTMVRGDVAWTTLHNIETWTPRSGPDEREEFLETVVLVKVDGGWKIDRYHASPVHPIKE